MLHIRSHYFRNANFSSLKTFKVHTSYAVQYFVPAYLLFSKTSRFIASFKKKRYHPLRGELFLFPVALSHGGGERNRTDDL